MPIESWGKSGVLAYFWLKIGYSVHIFWYMDFKFVLPIFYINFKGQTRLEVNLTKFDHFILWKPQKLSYLKTRFSWHEHCGYMDNSKAFWAISIIFLHNLDIEKCLKVMGADFCFFLQNFKNFIKYAIK